MQYYQLNFSLEERVIGKSYPQVEKSTIPTTWDDPLYIGQYIHQRAPKNVFVPKALIAKQAKVTDLVSAAPEGFASNLLVSNSLKSLVEESNYFGVDFFETSLIIAETKQELDYWIVHPYDSYFEALDFEKTTFFWTDFTLKPNLNKIYFSTATEIRKEYTEMFQRNGRPLAERKYLVIDNIVFKENCEIDFFSLYGLRTKGQGFFVSDKLKTSIEKHKCTGIVFTEANDPYI